VEAAMAKSKYGKTTGPSVFVVEILKASKESGKLWLAIVDLGKAFDRGTVSPSSTCSRPTVVSFKVCKGKGMNCECH